MSRDKKETIVDFLNRGFLPQNPIFIVGYPRSGTTLVQAILAAQKGLYTMPETSFFSAVYEAITVDEKGRIEASCLEVCFQTIQERMSIEFSSEESAVLFRMAQHKTLTPKYLFEFIVSKYVNPETVEEPDIFRWIEKTPNHVYALEQIVSYYPEAQFVNIVRYPIAAILSRRKHLSFKKEKSLEKLACAWVKSIHAVETFEQNYPRKCYTVKYEELVEDLENQLAKLAVFLKVEIAIERFKKLKQQENNFILSWESWKKGVISGEISNTNSAYQQEVSFYDMLRIQNIVRKPMEKFGYKLTYPLCQNIFDKGINFITSFKTI